METPPNVMKEKPWKYQDRESINQIEGSLDSIMRLFE